MWLNTRCNQISSFGETDESIYIDGGRQFIRLLAAELCASAVVMLDTPCSEVVWRVLATHSIRQFPLHFPTRASPCAITFLLDSNSDIFRSQIITNEVGFDMVFSSLSYGVLMIHISRHVVLLVFTSVLFTFLCYLCLYVALFLSMATRQLTHHVSKELKWTEALHCKLRISTFTSCRPISR